LYRDELSAAVARADALAEEVEELRQKGDLDRERIRRLEVLLGAARQELASARVQAPARAPQRHDLPRAAGPGPGLGTFASLVVLVLSVILLFTAGHC
jgi:hypothetical protein